MSKRTGFIMSMLITLLVAPAAPSLFANSSLDYLNRILGENGGNADKNMARLSQGFRLLVDDPVNYAIYGKLEAQVRGLAKEIGINKDVLGYYGYGESLLGNMIDSLQRVRELLLQKGNSVFAKEDLDMIDSEIALQYDQVLYLLLSAEFNKIRVFGTLFEDAQFKDIFKDVSYFSIANVDGMLGFLMSQRSYYGAKANQIEHRIKSQMTGKENYEGFQSTILDTDYGSETSMLLKNQVLILANILLLDMR